jgi:hypothetical protein
MTRLVVAANARWYNPNERDLHFSRRVSFGERRFA